MPYHATTIWPARIFKSRTFRIVAHPFLQHLRKSSAYILMDVGWRSGMCAGDVVVIRIFAVWVNMIQNYWSPTRNWILRMTMRRNAITSVSATGNGHLSACLARYHHHYPGLLRLSHDQSEYDLDFAVQSLNISLGEGNHQVRTCPDDVPLGALIFRCSFRFVTVPIVCLKKPGRIASPSMP